jgi:hypothetical protein
MPVILDPDSYDLWLDPGMTNVSCGVRTVEALRCSDNAVLSGARGRMSLIEYIFHLTQEF